LVTRVPFVQAPGMQGTRVWMPASGSGPGPPGAKVASQLGSRRAEKLHRAFLWSLACTVHSGSLWPHTIEMGDASIQASNHLLCVAWTRGFNKPNTELLHALSLATESLVARNGPGQELQVSNQPHRELAIGVWALPWPTSPNPTVLGWAASAHASLPFSTPPPFRLCRRNPNAPLHPYQSYIKCPPGGAPGIRSSKP